MYLEIFLFVCTALLAYLVVMLDNWSTTTLLCYDYALYSDTTFKQKIHNLYKKKGFLINELNPIARCFMKKFGYVKGTQIFSAFIRVPVFFFLFFVSLLDDPMFYMMFPFLMFYTGIIFSQILRAVAVTKRAKKLDYDLSKILHKLEKR